MDLPSRLHRCRKLLGSGPVSCLDITLVFGLAYVPGYWGSLFTEEALQPSLRVAKTSDEVAATLLKSFNSSFFDAKESSIWIKRRLLPIEPSMMNHEFSGYTPAFYTFTEQYEQYPRLLIILVPRNGRVIDPSDIILGRLYLRNLQSINLPIIAEHEAGSVAALDAITPSDNLPLPTNSPFNYTFRGSRPSWISGRQCFVIN